MTDDAAPQAPHGVDTERPSPARIYDWYLGGTQNWAVDREFGKRTAEDWPDAVLGARQNREFLGRAVRTAVEAGVRQFLDLGSGVPTVGNVHEAVAEHLPPRERATVVYVDYEPVAVAHSTVILEQQGAQSWTGVVQADFREPEAVLEHPETVRLIDFDRPVAVLMVAALHFVGPQDDPAAVVGAYRERMAPGSLLTISHLTTGGLTGEASAEIRRFAEKYRSTSNPVWLRERDELEPLFGGWPLLEPGLVHIPDWRSERELLPDEENVRRFGWCAMARKPA